MVAYHSCNDVRDPRGGSSDSELFADAVIRQHCHLQGIDELGGEPVCLRPIHDARGDSKYRCVLRLGLCRISTPYGVGKVHDRPSRCAILGMRLHYDVFRNHALGNPD